MAKFQEGLVIYLMNVNKYAAYKPGFYLVFSSIAIGVLGALLVGGNSGKAVTLIGIFLGIICLYDMLLKSRRLIGHEKWLLQAAQQEEVEVNYLEMSLHSPWLGLPRYGRVNPLVMLSLCFLQILLWGSAGYFVYAGASRLAILIQLGVSFVLHLYFWRDDRRSR